MSKQIDTLKKIKYKDNRLKGNSIKQSLINSGYTENTAIHSSTLSVVKCCEEELKDEFKASMITVDLVIKHLFEDRELARKKNDISTMKEVDKLLGQYLAMFTEKYKQEGDLPPPNYIINTINTNKDIKRDIPQVVLDDVKNK